MDVLVRDDHEGVATLLLNRPERRNALTIDLLRALVHELVAIQDSRHVRAVVLMGAGPTFCAGADLHEFAAAPDQHGPQRRIRLVTEVIARLRNLEQPTVAAVTGAAFGAGWGLSLACDLTYATSDASFCLPEVAKGLRLPTAITARLVQVVGPVAAAEIALVGASYTAADGVRAGWVARELDDAGALAAHTTTVARAMASRPRRAVEQVEQVLRRGSYAELTPPPEYGWNEESSDQDG
jgi:2-(1,2-epoxy-1,2-dihydrophenyl)acetyl-CoA isomerase